MRSPFRNGSEVPGNSVVPVIDVSALVDGAGARAAAAAEIDRACRAHGFFYVTGHGVAPDLVDRLAAASRRFFAQDEAAKARYAMSLEGLGRAASGSERWDGADLHAFEGTYGDYLLAKVSKVFPQLRRDLL